jgi:hypothetical protein
MKEFAPICLFTYKRLRETKETVKYLKANYQANQSELFIFSDGGKDLNSIEKINEVRDYLKSIDGFKSVTIYESDKNKGLAKSIISGVSKIFERYDRVIVLEDDLITSPNFLTFMNEALQFYNKNGSIHSVSGYTLPLPSLKKYSDDTYLGVRSFSWGWGTWKDEWVGIDWEVTDYRKFRQSIRQRIAFASMGSDLPGMLRKQMKGKIDSWFIRWCYHQFKQQKLTIFPSVSKVKNIGFSADATHTAGRQDRFETTFDEGYKTDFHFKNDLLINSVLLKELRKFYSIYRRILGKLLFYYKVFYRKYFS